MREIENLRKIQSYGTTLIEWSIAIQEALKTNDTKCLHNLKFPIGFTQGDYDEHVEINNRFNRLPVICRDYVSELSDEKPQYTNRALKEALTGQASNL